MRFRTYFSFLFFVVLACGCTSQVSTGGNPGSSSPAPLSKRVVAVSYPLQFLTQEIVGYEIVVTLPSGGRADDPRKSHPSREAIERMQESDLVIANGTGARYAKWMALVSLPESKIVNAASYGLALREFIQIKGESIVHSHGPEGEHSHPVMAARTWLDPALAKKQASYIAKQLKQTYPEHAEHFDENLVGLQTRLSELVTQVEELKKVSLRESPIVLTVGSKLLFFARAAGFTTQPISGFSKDADQTEAQLPQLLKAVENQLKEIQKQREGASSEGESPRLVVLDQKSQFPKTVLDLLTSSGFQPVEFELLDQQPREGDYIEAMKRNIVRFEKALQQ